MNSRITTTCPRCGRLEVACDEVTLVVNPHQGTTHYLFDCAGCAHQVIKAVPGMVTTAMSLLSIPVWTVPAEVPERQPLAGGKPPITMDDLLDTMLWLRDHDDLSDTELMTQQSLQQTVEPRGIATP